MPSVALNSKGERVEIRKIMYESDIDIFSYKSMAPFYCPHCQCEMHFKCGPKKCAHFSHKAKQDRDCIAHEYYSSESDEHIHSKLIIQSFLSEKTSLKIVQEVAVNNRERIADLAVLDSNQNPIVSIEIQLSKIKFETLMERTKDYNKNGISVIWLLGENNHDLSHKNNHLYTDLDYAFIKFQIENYGDGFSIFFAKDESEKDVWTRKNNSFLIALLCLEYSIKSVSKKYKTNNPEDIINYLNLDMENNFEALDIFLNGRDYVPDRKVTMWDLAFLGYRKQIRTIFLRHLSEKKEELDQTASSMLSQDRLKLSNEFNALNAKAFKEKRDAELLQNDYKNQIDALKKKEESLMEEFIQPLRNELEAQKARLNQKEIDLLNDFAIKEKNMKAYEKDMEKSLKERFINPEIKWIEQQKEALRIKEHNMRIERNNYIINVDEAKDRLIAEMSTKTDGLSRLIYERHSKLTEEIKTLRKIKNTLETEIAQWPDFIGDYFEKKKRKKED